MPLSVARSRSARSGVRGCCPDRGSRRAALPPQLRQQLWLWLDAVVDWLVTEYVWEVADTCWRVGRSIHTWCTRSRCHSPDASLVKA